MRPVDLMFPPEWQVSANPGGQSCTVSRRMGMTKERRTMTLPITATRVQDWVDGRTSGLVQDIFHDLNNDEREFLLSGMTPEDWKRAFG